MSSASDASIAYTFRIIGLWFWNQADNLWCASELQNTFSLLHTFVGVVLLSVDTDLPEVLFIFITWVLNILFQ